MQVTYFKPLFVIILMIMDYRYLEFGVFISVSYNHQNYNK